jgi:pilus assembly protein CpaC
MRNIKRIFCGVCIAAAFLGAPQSEALETGFSPASGSRAEHGALILETGTGKVLNLTGAASNIFVADPKVAEVRPASSSTLFVFGVSAGHTTIAAMDNSGRVLAEYSVTVQPSAFGAQSAEAMIARLLPGSRVKVQPEARGLLLMGSVANPADAAQAVAIAKGFIGDGAVDNHLSIMAPVQVTLNVRIAEMSRNVVRNLGVNWSALGSIGSIGHFPALTLNANADTLACALPVCRGANFNAVIDALAQDNLAHVLAEPNLTVMSGQAASFQVGGEYPIPVGQQNGTISIEFKNYGVILNFLPTVMSDGRINIHVKPEVSQLDKADGIQLTAGNSTIQIPALTVRRAESTVELGSGQSFAIAGLLQQTTQDNASGLPGLGDTPILGALFRDTAFQKQDMELVIVVTPYIVRPVNDPTALHLPSENYTPPSDLERLLFMRQVGNQSTPVPVKIPGSAGFVVQ